MLGTWGRGSHLPLYLAPQVRYLSSGTKASQFQVFPAFLIADCLPNVGGGREMSDNYRLYAQKMTERRTARDRGLLRGQLDELMRVVRRCEAMWALEDRIERSR